VSTLLNSADRVLLRCWICKVQPVQQLHTSLPQKCSLSTACISCLIINNDDDNNNNNNNNNNDDDDDDNNNNNNNNNNN